jgi:hypothetical protein
VRLDFALLADGVAASEGKFYIHGGGVRAVSVPQLPVPWRGGIAARLTADLSELGETHELIVRGFLPDDELFFEPAPITLDLSLPSPDTSDREIAVVLAFDIAGIPLIAEGGYRFEILLDDEVVAELPLRVDVRPGDFQDASRSGSEVVSDDVPAAADE